VQVTQALLKAISSSDSAAARRLMLPGAQLMAVLDPAPPQGTPQLRSDASFYRTLGAGTSKLLERMWMPTVTLHGSLAQVSAPYDFHIDGKFSHCGTDLFTLARSQGEWRVSGIAYTVQRAGCAPSPLGPPAAP
jgi:hypothetical protein